MYGDGDFQIGLGTDITAYAPSHSKGSNQWSYDFTIEGTTACRFVDSSGDPIKDNKNEAMWWQDIKVSGASDIYSRDDADWIGSSPTDQSGNFDYSAYALSRDGITLALTALNPAMGGLALGSTYFLSDMVHWVSSQSDSSGSVYRKWDYTPLNGPAWADSSTFLLVRDELNLEASESFTVKNTGIAFPEYPVVTEFDVSFTAPPHPDTLTAQEREEYGIKKVDTSEAAIAPANKDAASEEVFIADPKKNIEVSPVTDPGIADEVYKEMDEKREGLELE
ncbi:Halocin H4 [Natrialba aegyptia DSM 13077]|uniref:Halocin H4 n=2 Tax=Natrialba aegyptia TaxID=129789 RepID=M0AMR5_9EURY|nr:Halocin H4 [Natrialba aegyptia DSM 13077]